VKNFTKYYETYFTVLWNLCNLQENIGNKKTENYWGLFRGIARKVLDNIRMK
jgi:hypothetical protein